MELWKLFVTALMPVLKVLLITAVGTFLALHRFNILRESARKHLNTIVYFVFTPALVCSILAKTTTFKSLVAVWFMPLNILLTFIIGTTLGWLFMKITKAPPDMQGLVLGCCAAGNLGNLPLIIVPAVCKESSSPFGAVDVCNKKGMAYASLSMAVGHIYIWTFVYNIIRVYSCRIFNVNKVDDSTVGPAAIETDLENYSTRPVVTAEDLSQTNDHVSQFGSECALPGGRDRMSLCPNIFGNVDTLCALVLQEPKQKQTTNPLKTLVQKLNLKVLLAPATIGSILGLIIGVVPPFQKMFVGDDAPLRVIEDSASMLGDASIPAITLLVGANLLDGLKRSGMKLSLVVGIIVVRYIALPILGVGIVKGAIHFGLIHHDPLYQFILLLQYALPPAISISTITQLFGAGETECSIVMLATYEKLTLLRHQKSNRFGNPSPLLEQISGVLRFMVRKNVIVYFVFLPALVCSSLTKTITFGSLLLVWFMPLNVLLTYIIGAALGWLFLKIIKAPSEMQGLVLGCCAADSMQTGNLGSLPLIMFQQYVKNAVVLLELWMFVMKKGWHMHLSLAQNFTNKVDDSTVGPVSAIETDLESHSTVPVVASEVLSETNDHVTTLPGGRAKILGLIIGVVPPFRKMFVGDNAPLSVVEDSASMLGEASIPAMTLLLGANLLNGLKRSGMKFSLLMGITVIRYIALPILGVVIVKGAIHFGIIHHDPLYQFVLLLQYVLPPATSTITQLFGAGQTECSIVMLATYACNSFSLTLWSSLFMWLVL
ncbi:Protein PIN-LIKES 3 isoform C [Glycine soja]|uniref:Protein PIN-LIKES 3 isoform C n=1 Tax=Glycine soja TaxID=3848 RepID=A0A445IPT8_GLYSO|nr:Protein PIN-LIKES 3 isoform C [Glycine soja]